jgi:hypothetical protein
VAMNNRITLYSPCQCPLFIINTNFLSIACKWQMKFKLVSCFKSKNFFFEFNFLILTLNYMEMKNNADGDNLIEKKEKIEASD